MPLDLFKAGGAVVNTTPCYSQLTRQVGMNAQADDCQPVR